MAGRIGDAGVIGRSLPRARARRLAAGQGRYTDDIAVGRAAHAAFLRSPMAHARIVAIDTAEAAAMPGVIAVADGEDMARLVKPYAGIHQLFAGMKAPEQWPLARRRATWQGEPVAIVIAESRAEAEDAAEKIAVEWEPLPAVSDVTMAAGAPPIHAEVPGNLAYQTVVAKGDIERAARAAAAVVDLTFRFARHTGVCLEPRTIVADYVTADRTLTVTQSHQCPSQQQDIYARLLGLEDHGVRVVCPDVGGAFGIKQQLYGDELAVCAMAMRLGRPVKFVADRLESLMADIHSRDHLVRGRLAVAADGRFLGLSIEDDFGIGAYSQYPRSSMGEGSHVLRLSGGPYALDHYCCALRVYYQNKGMIGHYRSVGHPIAVAATEALVDEAARRLEIDPAEIRRRNYIPDEAYPYASHGGFAFERLMLRECHDRMVALIDLPRRRAEQAELRKQGRYRGIGLAAFVELTGTGPDYYGKGEVRVSAQDGCWIKLEPSGLIRCAPSVTDQGQGTDQAIAMVVAEVLGLRAEDVAVVSGDSQLMPYGGGAWASRGASFGAEAAHRAASALAENILTLAGHALQAVPATLALKGGFVVDRADARRRLSLADVARIGYFRQDTLPPGVQPELNLVRHFVLQGRPFLMTNGIHGSSVEVDVDTGIVTLLKHYMVHDSGTVINPLLLDEQIRGGVVQGLGAALFEEIAYGEEGQLLTGSLADYLVPMAAEMPDIEVAHVSLPDPATSIGAKGVGEAGVAGSAAAVLNAINDALAPFRAVVTQLPATPERILRALGRVS